METNVSGFVGFLFVVGAIVVVGVVAKNLLAPVDYQDQNPTWEDDILQTPEYLNILSKKHYIE